MVQPPGGILSETVAASNEFETVGKVPLGESERRRLSGVRQRRLQQMGAVIVFDKIREYQREYQQNGGGASLRLICKGFLESPCSVPSHHSSFEEAKCKTPQPSGLWIFFAQKSGESIILFIINVIIFTVNTYGY